MEAARFDALVQDVTGDQAPRVWSLLVTVFGDLAREPGAVIGGTTLGRLTDLVGLKPQAVRVALHRLRKDGWIDSQRNGRNSDYALTVAARADSAAASVRIYGPLGADAGGCWLALGDPRLSCDLPGVKLADHMALTLQPPPDSQVFRTRIDRFADLPPWMVSALCGDDLTGQAQRLAASLGRVQNALLQTPAPSALQCAALRILVVHNWRRIILRLPVLVDQVFQTEWPVAACRTQVEAVLTQLPRPDLHRIETDIAAQHSPAA